MARKLVELLTVCAALCGAVLAGGANAAVPAWTTYRHDAARSSFDPDSTIPIAPTPAWQTPTTGAGALDGTVWGQPLVYGSRAYVATENNTIYALDAATGALVWSTHVATPESSGTAPCGDIGPTIGITSTPVIDPATNRIYAVAAVRGSGGSVTHQLFAVDLGTGAVLPGFPVNADPPRDNPVDVLQRPALTLQGNRVLVGYGGNDGDCASYHGWLVSVPTAGGAKTSFEADPSAGNHGGAIWGSGGGPALDADGNVWVATGNGFGGSAFDFSESVVHLGPSMSLVSPGSYWAPPNWKTLDNTDADLGSSEPVLLPDNLILQSGKDGNAYLINGVSPGGVSNPIAALHFCSGGSFGGAVYLASTSTIYVACTGGLKALKLNPATRTLALDTSFAAPSAAIGPPIIAGGLVWVTAWGSGKLYGLDPTTGQVKFQTAASMEHFATPSAGGGRLFLAAGNQVLALTVGTAPLSQGGGGGAPPGGGPGVTPAPRIFGARLVPAIVRRARRGTTLRLRLSEAGRVTVSISRLLGGRRVHGHCVAGARHGRRCTVLRLRARRRFTAAAGPRRLRLVLRGLGPGSYLVRIALNAHGKPSRPVTLRLRITGG
ncbi:MAG: PQQ-binding-like beta-propeller repeat protein [Actinomycetota bacterium]|nr:PQQ-binding-like beta-propeller repeat protein [Actinomycetota bacterium]